MAILTVRNLTFQYALGNTPALTDLSFSVEKGDFVTICGATGSGKSTLLRMLKKELVPEGKLCGQVFYEDTELPQLPDVESARSIGYVMQRPEQQLVTDKVWHELAFGLENLGVPGRVIHRRVAEMASYFGIEDWFDKSVDDLSGGQKQLLNLAAIMVMGPEVLILDEPTSQLDPVAASDFLETVGRLNRDTGVTVILVEHRLEQAIPMGNKLMVLDQGRLLHYGTPKEVCSRLADAPELLDAMPAAVRLYHAFYKEAQDPIISGKENITFPHGDNDCPLTVAEDDCPLTVMEGNRWIRKNFPDHIRSVPRIPYILSETPALEITDLWFRYDRRGRDVLRGTDLTVYEGEIFCILGGNGSGKSTTLNNAAGLLKPYRGCVRVFGKPLAEYPRQTLYQGCLSLLPQDVQTVFLCNTVREELKDAGASLDSLPYDLSPLMDRHPYDLSGGQQQLVALAKVLAARPRLLLLDEPTKGIDAHARKGLMQVLRSLRDQGMTIVMVTHDVDFAAEISDRCAMFFRGEVTSIDEPWHFFAENHFYTTAVNRMTRDYYDNCITLQDAVTLCGMNRDDAMKCGTVRDGTAFCSMNGTTAQAADDIYRTEGSR